MVGDRIELQGCHSVLQVTRQGSEDRDTIPDRVSGVNPPVGWKNGRVEDDWALVEKKGGPTEHFFDLPGELPWMLALYICHALMNTHHHPGFRISNSFRMHHDPLSHR